MSGVKMEVPALTWSMLLNVNVLLATLVNFVKLVSKALDYKLQLSFIDQLKPSGPPVLKNIYHFKVISFYNQQDVC